MCLNFFNREGEEEEFLLGKCPCGTALRYSTGENFTGSICQSQEIIGSRFSVNTSGPSPHSTSRPMRVESVTTVGFSIVNISLTRWACLS